MGGSAPGGATRRGTHPRGTPASHKRSVCLRRQRGRQHHGRIDPALDGRRLPTDELRPKSLAECPRVDFVITVCPRAEVSLPEDWPGDPVIAHWSVDEQDMWDMFWVLMRRIKIFTSLPHGSMPRRSL